MNEFARNASLNPNSFDNGQDPLDQGGGTTRPGAGDQPRPFHTVPGGRDDSEIAEGIESPLLAPESELSQQCLEGGANIAATLTSDEFVDPLHVLHVMCTDPASADKIKQWTDAARLPIDLEELRTHLRAHILKREAQRQGGTPPAESAALRALRLEAAAIAVRRSRSVSAAADIEDLLEAFRRQSVEEGPSPSGVSICLREAWPAASPTDNSFYFRMIGQPIVASNSKSNLRLGRFARRLGKLLTTHGARNMQTLERQQQELIDLLKTERSRRKWLGVFRR